MTERLDVVGIGNAIVDVLSHADDDLLIRHGLNKGAMTLIDAARADALYAVMGGAIEASGGSAANTMAGIASLGGRGAFIGKVADDQLGAIFRHDTKAAGTGFATPPSRDGAPTARCLIFVTPDAQRTMNTYLGACLELGPEDVDPALVGAAKVTYLEGYLWDPPRAKEAFVKAAALAHAAGNRVALTLSDSFCVARHRDEFLTLVDEHVDILFANEAEICALWQVADFDAAPIDRLVDTTGAGDQYAAGFLHGYCQGYDLARCGRIASLAAAEVLQHFGARPAAPLRDLVRARLA